MNQITESEVDPQNLSMLFMYIHIAQIGHSTEVRIDRFSSGEFRFAFFLSNYDGIKSTI